MSQIAVKGVPVQVISIEDKDYISLTDMVRNIDNGLALIEKWLRNKNTIEFLGIEIEKIKGFGLIEAELENLEFQLEFELGV